MQLEDHTVKNLSIGYWQLYRVYSTAGLGERAVYFGKQCLEVSLEHKFYIGYAYEALCRAYALLGQTEASKEAYSTALIYVEQIVDENSKEMLVKDLQTIE